MPDGTVVYASSEGSEHPRLRRTNLTGQLSNPLTGPEYIAHFPSIGVAASGRLVLVYQKKERWTRIWRGQPGSGSDPTVAVDSTWTDSWPNLAPDGDRLTFTSTRSGATEIWVSPTDNSGQPVQLTERNGPYSDMPRWSPVGFKITFSSADAEQNRDVYLSDVASGETTRFTTEASEEGRASWSRDGQWICFRSDRSGPQEIWKRQSDGTGEAIQMTFQGGYEAFESFDGQIPTIFTTGREPNSGRFLQVVANHTWRSTGPTSSLGGGSGWRRVPTRFTVPAVGPD